jgi:iron complex outermembrane receptor protein
MIKRAFRVLTSLLVALGPVSPAAANEDVFQFLAEETKVVTASRVPQTISHSPATVYVITGEDIKAMGALTLWDALRTVPGVDVASARTGQGAVSIRGLNGPLNNRTLILLDGKNVLNSFFDFALWGSIPVTMQEIDRIEIVEGPASALYGANATNGVINIITKRPEHIKGGEIRYTGGERETVVGSALYGDKRGPFGYKLSVGFDSFNRFEHARENASKMQKFSGEVGYEPSEDTKFTLSAAGSNGETDLSIGNTGVAVYKGPSTLVGATAEHKGTRLRGYWNRSRYKALQFLAFQEPNVDYDTYDVNLEQSLDLPLANTLVVGGTYRRNQMRSRMLSPGLLTQDLWGLFFEDQWKPIDHWTVVGSGRLDRHPFTPLIFSPRGSLIFDPVPEHVFRVSAGKSFRTPTLIENSLDLTQIIDVGFGATVNTHTSGNRVLKPETMEMYEIAYNGTFGSLRTKAVGFKYKLKDIINTDKPTTVPGFPVTFVNSSFSNSGEVAAIGGELGAEYQVNRQALVFGNYSYQDMQNAVASRDAGSPKHKANAGVRGKAGSFTGSLWANWVDKTHWANNSPGQTPYLSATKAYTLLNAHAGYSFSGKLSGLEMAVSAFNLAQHRHYELLPNTGAGTPGQNGEIIGSRWTGTVRYHF